MSKRDNTAATYLVDFENISADRAAKKIAQEVAMEGGEIDFCDGLGESTQTVVSWNNKINSTNSDDDDVQFSIVWRSYRTSDHVWSLSIIDVVDFYLDACTKASEEQKDAVLHALRVEHERNDYEVSGIDF